MSYKTAIREAAGNKSSYISWQHHFNPGAANWYNTRNIPSVVCVAPPEDEQLMLENM
jgi:hypothetical protein